MKLYEFYSFLDLAGTFAFAVSGATAARQRGLDVFGIYVIAFAVACGGGIIRDLCLGALPPAGLINWRYLAATLFAGTLTIGFYPVVKRIMQPVLLFDAAGLSLFAVTGAQKTLLFGFSAQMAVILGVTTAVGGGVLRDVLLNRIPVILEKEIYASAAFLASLIIVIGAWLFPVHGDLVSLFALATAFSLRMLALRYHWNMPVPK